MKVLIPIIILIIVGIGGIFAYQLLTVNKISSHSEQTHETPADNQSVTRTGVLRKGSSADSTYILIESDKTEAVSSTTVKFDQYIGKKVEITGQYSGTTVYADSIVGLK